MHDDRLDLIVHLGARAGAILEDASAVASSFGGLERKGIWEAALKLEKDVSQAQALLSAIQVILAQS